MSSLFAHETEQFIKGTRHLWLDQGYVHPLFAPMIDNWIYHSEYMYPCSTFHSSKTKNETIIERIHRHINKSKKGTRK